MTRFWWFTTRPRGQPIGENEPALHEAKDEAEARYYEAEAEFKKFGHEAVLAWRY